MGLPVQSFTVAIVGIAPANTASKTQKYRDMNEIQAINTCTRNQRKHHNTKKYINTEILKT